LEDHLLKNSRLKRVADSVLKHAHSNTTIYLTMIGSLFNEDYPTALACLKAVVLRTVFGAAINRIKPPKDSDDKPKT
jgi:hypothetical protein